ncbi:Rhodanese-like protein [Wilcoxina mikolae CBS 423.85]|nr:Rhodanese-like protein [Wilcoxina mikolae CBS 423.85]
MSANASKLARISPERLSTLLLTEPTEEKVVVVDVRDSDHIGGHIKGSRHVPSGTLSYTTPELVRNLKGTEKVVFHCALSQERGPSAAKKYMRERERMFGLESIAKEMKWEDDGEAKERDETAAVKQQEVFVLDGGFVQWQKKFGNDERLTEKYDKELWEEGW